MWSHYSLDYLPMHKIKTTLYAYHYLSPVPTVATGLVNRKPVTKLES